MHAMSVPETWLPWESCGSSLGSSTLSCTVADAPVGSVYTSASACSTKIEQDTTQTRTYIASSSVSNIMYALGARSCACTPQLGNRFVSCVWAGAPPHGGADHVCFNHEPPCSGSPVSVRTNFSLVIYILMEGPSNFSIFLFGVSFGLHWFVLSVILVYISFCRFILLYIG